MVKNRPTLVGEDSWNWLVVSAQPVRGAQWRIAAACNTEAEAEDWLSQNRSSRLMYHVLHRDSDEWQRLQASSSTG